VNPAKADFNFPYANIKLNLPVYDEPYIGLGNYYSSLSDGIKTVLWNPAGIMKIPTVEASATIPMAFGSFSFGKTTKVDDFDFSSGSGSLTTGIYWTDDQSDLVKKQRNMNSQLNYTNSGASLIFDQAIRFTDSFAFGVKALNPSEIRLDMAGDFPLTSQYTANFYNITNYGGSGMSIDNSGKLTYTYSSGGLNYTYVSEQPLWSGFLNQYLKLPTKTVSSLRNSINVKNSIVLTGGFKSGSFLFGLNIIPISAQAVFDNSVKAIVSQNASDMYFYTPDFTPSDEKSVANWTMDPNLYATYRGYKANPINVPAGEVVLDSRYQGTYTGSALRMDLGLSWDIENVTNISIVSENLGNASLNMKGSGISYYANHRFNSTTTPNIDPATGVNWSPFVDHSTDFTFPDGKGLYMENEKTYNIPQRLRIGVAIKKPFLIAIDYETLNTPLTLLITDNTGSTQKVNLTNIKVLRIGSEMQVFKLPLWLRGGFGFLYKPVADNSDVQEKIDSIFKIGSKSLPFFPFKFDFGLNTEVYGTQTGLALGIDGLSLINLYTVDLLYSGVGKTAFWTFYAKKGSWQFSYISSVDVVGTVSSIQSQGRSLSSFTYNDAKWNQVVAVTYRF
jgi:hypothetical protein